MQGQDTKGQYLLPIEDFSTVQVTDRIFYQAFLYFKVCSWAGLIYNILRSLAGLYMVGINYSLSFNIFLFYLLIVSFLQMAYYSRLLSAARNISVYYEIAESAGHLAHLPSNSLPLNTLHSNYRTAENYDFTDHQSEDDQKKMKEISGQIRNFIHLSNKTTDSIYKIKFGAYQVAHVWALFLLLFYYFSNELCENFITVIFILGTYQYFEIYVLVLFFIVVLPFYAIKQLYIYILNRYKAFKLQRALRSQLFGESIIGDHQCKICLMPYEQKDTIIILKCNDMHHFHSSCINQWTHSSLTCPLCRVDLTTN